MRIEGLKQYIVDLYNAGGDSILLVGPAGIGKTTAVNEAGLEIAGKVGGEFIDYRVRRGNMSEEEFAGTILENPDKFFPLVEFNLNTCEPSDISGIPDKSAKIPAIVNKPYAWALCLAACKGGILFLDEITNVQRLDVLTASYKIVLERSAGFTKFSNKVMVIVAGNSPEDSSAANLLPAPLVNRFTVCNVELPEVFAWAEWMDKTYKDQWDRRALGYLKHLTEDFLKPPGESETLTNFPTPRGWTKVALLSKKLNPSHLRETLIGSLGPEVGEKFYGFINTEIPATEELLRDPRKFARLDVNQRYLASVLVGADLRNRFSQAGQDETNKAREVEKTIPLLKSMADVQHDFAILTTFSCGEERFGIALAVGRKDRELKALYTNMSDARFALEI